MTAYYISNAGDNGNLGTSELAPWETIAKVNGESFSAGDSILFNRDDTWREELTVPSPGSSGNPITFGAYSTGADPIINGADVMATWVDSGQGLGSTWKKINVTDEPLDIVVMDGTLLTEGSAKDVLNDHEWVWDTDVLYLRDDTGDPDGSVAIEAQQRNNGIYAVDKSYITVNNIHVKYTVYGFNFAYSGSNISNIIIDDCTSDYSRWDGVIFYDTTYTASNITISNCTLHHSTVKSSIYTRNVDGGTVESNDCYSNYEHGYYCDNTDNMIIRYNSFHDNGFNGWKFQGTSSDNQAYYNLSYNNGTHGLRLGDVADTVENNVIYNNAFYNNTKYGIYCWTNTGANIFKNNIIHQADAGGDGDSLCFKIASDAIAQLQTMDYNSYYYPNATNAGDVVIVTGVQAYTLTEWKASGYGQDAHSVGTDPLFVDAANNNFRLENGSPCINAGIDVGLTIDYQENPVGSPPEMGAYEELTFIVNAITTRGAWRIVDAYSVDVNTSIALLADIVGHEYQIKSLSFEINDNDTWFKLFDGTTLKIGPVKPRTNPYHRDYESPIRIDGAINIQTESNKQIHITIAYKVHKVG